MKLVQKQFLKGRREFEISGDAVNVRLKSALREEKLTVMLAVLNPEPVRNGAGLEFHSRVKSDPLLSLWLNNPNRAEFDAFVDQLRRRAREEYNRFAGIRSGPPDPELAGNVYDEPPDFDAPATSGPPKKTRPLNPESIDTSIVMLKRYLAADEIESFLEALEALREAPGSATRFAGLVTAFDELGSSQGAVLTYAPYVGVMLSDESFGDD